MTIAAVTSAVCVRNAATTMSAYVNPAENEGVYVDAGADDQKVLIFVKNATTNATHTAVICKGNGLQGVKDLEITMAATNPGLTKVIVVESGAYKFLSGDNKGKILIKDKSTTNTNLISVAAVVLP